MCGDKSTPTFSAEVEITGSRKECRIESDDLRLHKDFDKFESLAQLVEHLTFNQDVSGSIPEWFINRSPLGRHEPLGANGDKRKS